MEEQWKMPEIVSVTAVKEIYPRLSKKVKGEESKKS